MDITSVISFFWLRPCCLRRLQQPDHNYLFHQVLLLWITGYMWYHKDLLFLHTFWRVLIKLRPGHNQATNPSGDNCAMSNYLDCFLLFLSGKNKMAKFLRGTLWVTVVHHCHRMRAREKKCHANVFVRITPQKLEYPTVHRNHVQLQLFVLFDWRIL